MRPHDQWCSDACDDDLGQRRPIHANPVRSADQRRFRHLFGRQLSHGDSSRRGSLLAERHLGASHVVVRQSLVLHYRLPGGTAEGASSIGDAKHDPNHRAHEQGGSEHHMSRARHLRSLQRGMVLVSSLLLLVVVTILAIGMFRSFGLDEKIAGNTREKQRALQAAVSAQQYAEWWLSVGNAINLVSCSGSYLVTTGVPICTNTLQSVVGSSAN